MFCIRLNKCLLQTRKICSYSDRSEQFFKLNILLMFLLEFYQIWYIRANDWDVKIYMNFNSITDFMQQHSIMCTYGTRGWGDWMSSQWERCIWIFTCLKNIYFTHAIITRGLYTVRVYHDLLLIQNHSWILTVHKARILRKERLLYREVAITSLSHLEVYADFFLIYEGEILCLFTVTFWGKVDFHSINTR